MATGTLTDGADARLPQPPAAPSARVANTHRVTVAYPTAATVTLPCWRFVGASF
jgi:hypothetical protein